MVGALSPQRRPFAFALEVFGTRSIRGERKPPSHGYDECVCTQSGSVNRNSRMPKEVCRYPSMSLPFSSEKCISETRDEWQLDRVEGQMRMRLLLVAAWAFILVAS